MNTILARGGGKLNDRILKSSNARALPGGGGMLKFRFERRITLKRRIFTRIIIIVAVLQAASSFLSLIAALTFQLLLKVFFKDFSVRFAYVVML